VFIGSPDEEQAQKAISMVESLTKEVEVGEIYTGKATRLTSFGAFVEILPGKEGLVRLGDLADVPVRRPEDVVRIGDEVMVMVIEVDDMGRVNLSRRAVLEGLSPQDALEASKQAQFAAPGGRGGREREREQRPPRRDYGGRGGGQGGGRRGGGNGRPRGGGGGGGGGGPYPRSQQRPGRGGGFRRGPNDSPPSPERDGFRRGPGDPPPPPPSPPGRRW
jgi:polyribonucleotide nucleotidyltransferase